MVLGFSTGKRGPELRRKVAAIAAYTGPNGGGKTLAMVTDGLEALRSGRPILSNLRVHDVNNPRLCDDPDCSYAAHAEDHPDHLRHLAAAPNWVPFDSWGAFLDFERGEVWADEITSVAGSGDWSSLPSEVVDRLQQLRRGELVWRQTSPDFARTDKRIREVTQSVTVCRGYVSRRLPNHVWRAHQLFVWLTFNAKLVTDMDNQMKGIKATVRQIAWRPEVFAAYDTYAPVLRPRDVHQGTCLHCGGRIPQPRCTCDSAEGAPSPRGERSERGAGVNGVPLAGVSSIAKPRRALSS